MDNIRFDGLAKRLAAVSSRRRVLALGATALGTLWLRDAPEGAVARKRRKRKNKQRRRRPCTPACPANSCGGDGCGGQCAACHPVDRCAGGECVCSVAGKLGPGDLCAAADDCCPYAGLGDRSCDFGAGACQGAFKSCRYGVGGKCFDNCDCSGDLVCNTGLCCPPGNQCAIFP